MRTRKDLLTVAAVVVLLMAGILAGILQTGFPGAMEESEVRPEADRPEGEEVSEEEIREEREEEVSPDREPGAEETAGSGERDISREMIIKRGKVHLQVDQVREVSQEVRGLTEDLGGYVEESSFEEEGERKRVEYNLRVPAENFDELLEGVSGTARLKKEDVSTEEVTEEYIDLKARKEVKEEQEGRLLEMMEEAEEIEDWLELERELLRVREEIERIQGRMEYLERATTYSYLQVLIEQEKVGTPQPENVGEEFLFSFQEGWRGFTAVLVSTVAFLLRIWPFVIIAAVVGAGVWYRRKSLS